MKMSTLLFILALYFISLNTATYGHTDSIVEKWKSFKEKFKKSYNSKAEEKSRLQVFLENVKEIEYHNKLLKEGKVSYKQAINRFSDMRYEELIEKMTGYDVELELLSDHNRFEVIFDKSNRNDVNTTIPNFVDWRTKGAVTPVKHQGSCGSCWAFSATGSLEGQLFRKTGQLINLSEQNLVDCAHSHGAHGCRGGLMNLAFQYVNDNGGISRALFYPYKGLEGFCKYIWLFSGAFASGYVPLPRGDEKKLQEAVAKVGPISVAIMVTKNFAYYKEGIFYDETCTSERKKLNHGVLVVGYGTTEKGEDYWIVKNSWGKQWGNRGYIKMARNKNMCGIVNEASYPIV